jgi:hypothetical protein
MIKTARQLLSLVVLALLVAQPDGHASELGSPLESTPIITGSIVTGAAVCDEQTLRVLIDTINDRVYLRRANGSYWLLSEHALKVGFGGTLRNVKVEFDVLQSGGWSMWVLAPDTEEAGLIGANALGIMSYTLPRPSVNGLGWEFGAWQLATLEDLPNWNALPVPDLVIEPQTGCPEDTTTILGPIEG